MASENRYKNNLTISLECDVQPDDLDIHISLFGVSCNYMIRREQVATILERLRLAIDERHWIEDAYDYDGWYEQCWFNPESATVRVGMGTGALLLPLDVAEEFAQGLQAWCDDGTPEGDGVIWKDEVFDFDYNLNAIEDRLDDDDGEE